MLFDILHAFHDGEAAAAIQCHTEDVFETKPNGTEGGACVVSRSNWKNVDTRQGTTGYPSYISETMQSQNEFDDNLTLSYANR